jgi:hypothetical protein
MIHVRYRLSPPLGCTDSFASSFRRRHIPLERLQDEKNQAVSSNNDMIFFWHFDVLMGSILCFEMMET